MGSCDLSALSDEVLSLLTISISVLHAAVATSNIYTNPESAQKRAALRHRPLSSPPFPSETFKLLLLTLIVISGLPWPPPLVGSAATLGAFLGVRRGEHGSELADCTQGLTGLLQIVFRQGRRTQRCFPRAQATGRRNIVQGIDDRRTITAVH